MLQISNFCIRLKNFQNDKLYYNRWEWIRGNWYRIARIEQCTSKPNLIKNPKICALFNYYFCALYIFITRTCIAISQLVGMTEQKKQNILVRQYYGYIHARSGKCTATAAAVGRLSVLNDKVPTALRSNNSSRRTVVFLSLLFYFYSFAGRLRWDRPTDNYHYFNRTVFEGTKGYTILYTRYLNHSGVYYYYRHRLV